MPNQNLYLPDRWLELWNSLENKSAFVQDALAKLKAKIDTNEPRNFKTERLKGELEEVMLIS